MSRPRSALNAAVVLLAIEIGCGSSREPPPCRATPVTGSWLETHQGFVKRAQQGDIDILFLGDSITAWWAAADGGGNGPSDVWERYYLPRKAVNFGIPGDRVQHLLWRVENGEVDGTAPKAVVVLIGTNNVKHDTPDEIAQGVTKLVKTLRKRLPRSKVLLLGLFPRSSTPDSLRERNRAVNDRLKRLDDRKFVTYLDVGPNFIEPDGTISKTMMPDGLHLSGKGYQTWAEAMEPTLSKLLGTP